MVDLNYNFECDWLIELSESKLPNNNLASELKNRSFFKPITIKEIVIFMINCDITNLCLHCSKSFYSLTKAILFYPYFMTILMLSHLFFPYFFPTELYFIPILSDRENRAPILFVFYFYFKSIFHREVYFISIFSNRTVTQSKKQAILILFYVLISVLLNKTAIK